jgi:quercetin dioxygenase-like cupin family protein
MLLEGEMEFTVESEVIRPRIGEELLIPARSTHSAHNIGSSTARWLYGYKQE